MRGVVLGIADRENTADCSAGITDRRSRPESDIPEVELIRAEQAAVAGQIQHLTAELGRMVEDQRPRRTEEFHEAGIRARQVEARAGIDLRRLAHRILGQQNVALCLDERGGKIDHAVAVQVLVEAGLQGFQRRAVSRDGTDRIGDDVAAAVGIPHRKLRAACKLQRYLVSGRRRFDADRLPCAELARHDGRAAILQFGADTGAVAGQIEIVADRDQAGRTGIFDGRDPDHAIPVQVLTKAGFERFKCGARSQNRTDRIADDVAAAIGIPDRKLVGARKLQGHLIAGPGRLGADRRPRAELSRHERGAAI